MKDSRSHISIVCVAVWLLTGILFGTMHGLAQTPAGMHIYNEAKGTFRYKSGVSDSLRSNMTETVVRSAHYVASSLQLTVGRVAIEGSGQDSVVAIATVLDSSH